ncbi:MAG: redox-regulated ATPase YchF [Pseudomonadales bacterium]|jgi:GTP-binding protein YchF|nr:redox-regulated ATPase YchF [Pseudomonadales bacterium]
MSLSIGIVGLPNVGKSTLFNALLKREVALAANYPFATIEPNVGIAEVPDERLAPLAEVVNTQVIKPATIEFVDIAGLVKGASNGEGLGNKFLAHIREVAAICHVLRDFKDEDIIREGAVSPLDDLQVIRMELQLADLATLEKQRPPKGAVSTEDKKKFEVVGEFLAEINSGQNIFNLINRQTQPEKKELMEKVAKELNLLTSKSELFVLNVDEGEVKNEQELKKKWADILQTNSQSIVVVSAKIEAELANLSDEEQQMFLEDLGLQESGLLRLARVAYQTLNLQSFLTAGELEVRAWTISAGTKAPQAAGVIHTDFENKFIRANVADYQDFIELKGWKNLVPAGKVRSEGKEYVMKPDDIVEFMIGT